MGINEKLEKLINLLEESQEKKKEKKYRLPFGKKVSNRQRRKNYITIFKLNENNSIDIKKVKIDEQTIMEDEIPRLAGAGYIFYWKKNPMMIIPSWSMKPLSSKEEYEKSLEDGSNAAGYRLLIHRMESESTLPKRKMGNPIGWILGLGLLVIIGYAFLTGGGG